MITENYIKMCEQAEEIQVKWKPQIGDTIKHKLTKSTQLITLYDIETYSDDFYIEEKYTWLPTQEQLQEILLKGSDIFEEYDNVVSMIYCFQLWLNSEFYGYYMHKPYPKGNILNELWLTFVMHECYNKVWSKGRWIKNEDK